jgi:hypothetical protein
MPEDSLTDADIQNADRLIRERELHQARAYRRFQVSMFFENAREWLWKATKFVFLSLFWLFVLFLFIRLIHFFWYLGG